MPVPLQLNHVAGAAVLSPINELNLSTNQANGFALAGIENLALIPDQLPRTLPP
jgi:hypothetical protein